MDAPPPPPSPLPYPTPGPAATTSAPEFIPNPAATTPERPPSHPSPPAGRSKSMRWCRDTPPSGKSGGPSPISFRDVLLVGIGARAPPLSSPTGSREAPPSPAIRLVVHPERRQPAALLTDPDAEGWRPALSRRARLAAGRLARGAPRPVPVDLQGKCFNCFSPKHRAAFCKSCTRCFHCRATGHRSYVCPSRRSRIPDAAHPRLVWRPVAATSPAASSSPAPMDAPGAAAPAPPSNDGSGRRRRRHRKRHRNRGPPSPTSGDSETAPSLALSGDGRPATVGGQDRRPRCLLMRSAGIARREANLSARALVVSVVADCPGDLADSIVPALAQWLEIEASSLSLLRLGTASFLLISPDEATATRILNGAQPLMLPSGRLFFSRWTRFLNSSAGTLSSAVDIELKGIPAHVWDMDTAAQLLGGCCLPIDLHPATSEQRDNLTWWPGEGRRIVTRSSTPSQLP
ncbi:hypothetical protein PVAP13_8KG400001 [Panicum virgatum]|uniref:CCHC-type domain-containing protein n=1 Tax=Panicum virgatum TaxID=38727 RepID=A0A8T0PNL2_PANVG|nr:hypothetical protein PVAP13_8KG400001 [Panicum virgatum]